MNVSTRNPTANVGPGDTRLPACASVARGGARDATEKPWPLAAPVTVIARPLGYQTFFKDGSEPTSRGQLVHQIDRLEGHGRTFSIAVMTDGDPSMQYGIETIQGVAAALLRNN
jgi:hypothetical protein